eukprot:CAMPEP_0179427950 /NCGR_PEP_ID=MMETSP0799-20121207/13755_1 /TAXON_ID=46947 /ORGANISM="Geminigera cryophila, Strain CCMP2564" /LENGTH=256 /DNA_ID=CAMNT_0021203223 /DNA_START=250 /DNA_END=1017 /DNA_ORIENTATION=+
MVWMVRAGRVPGRRAFILLQRSMCTVCSQLENTIKEDPGKRGIAPLCIPGDLAAAAKILAAAKSVAILSGYPCCLADPPTETDGPPGALAIARALVALGKRATILTDLVNEAPFRAALAASCLVYSSGNGDKGEDGVVIRIIAYAGGDIQAQEVADELDLDTLVAIERPGPALDGKYYTMSARDMTQSVAIARLEQLLVAKNRNGVSLASIGIGDGGNEVGMGKVQNGVRQHITHGELIASTAATDHLIVCGVSNW